MIMDDVEKPLVTRFIGKDELSPRFQRIGGIRGNMHINHGNREVEAIYSITSVESFDRMIGEIIG